ncbi:MAG: hypothetical protein LBC04_02280 [Holosporaceae bacterium]|nr:hypothetical protein [Holosporaceae bacterium]
MAFWKDGCQLTTENTTKVILEYFRSGRYLTESTGHPEFLFEKLSAPEQERAKKIIRESFSHQISLIDTLRTKRSGNPPAQWILKIIDAEDI